MKIHAAEKHVQVGWTRLTHYHGCVYIVFFRAFEAEVRTYTGDDPLEVWYRY